MSRHRAASILSRASHAEGVSGKRARKLSEVFPSTPRQDSRLVRALRREVSVKETEMERNFNDYKRKGSADFFDNFNAGALEERRKQERNHNGSGGFSPSPSRVQRKCTMLEVESFAEFGLDDDNENEGQAKGSQRYRRTSAIRQTGSTPMTSRLEELERLEEEVVANENAEPQDIASAAENGANAGEVQPVDLSKKEERDGKPTDDSDAVVPVETNEEEGAPPPVFKPRPSRLMRMRKKESKMERDASLIAYATRSIRKKIKQSVGL